MKEKKRKKGSSKRNRQKEEDRWGERKSIKKATLTKVIITMNERLSVERNSIHLCTSRKWNDSNSDLNASFSMNLGFSSRLLFTISLYAMSTFGLWGLSTAKIRLRSVGNKTSSKLGFSIQVIFTKIMTVPPLKVRMWNHYLLMGSNHRLRCHVRKNCGYDALNCKSDL